MYVETEHDFQNLKRVIADGESFWIPMYSDPYRHYMQNDISFIYIYSISHDQDYIISFRHTDCLSLEIERLTELQSSYDIFVLAKKRFCRFYSNKCIDADLVAWWMTHKALPLDDTNTMAHESWNRWWYNETNTHDWLPITCHIERCMSMRQQFMKMYKTFERTDSFDRYERLLIDNMFAIENAGISVQPDIFNEKLKADVLLGNTAYTEYNPYTITGRPSNKHGGVNYAALNKDDKSRSAFVSRHNRGMLLEMDFDAFHVRLIADMINYKLPIGSIHEYFGKQYFNVSELTSEQYEESKQITFRLLYGGIDDDFAKIPFFGQVRNFIRKTWSEYKSNGVVHTPIMNRPMYQKHLPDMNPNKLFNYILQASETEHNLHVIDNVLAILQEYKSQLVLYTYDSLLFDFDLSDGGDLVHTLVDTISSQNKFPVKIKVGSDYHSMMTMNYRK